MVNQLYPNVNENEFFRQVVLRICKNLDFEIALQDCLRYIGSYIPADMFQLNIYDQGLGALRNIAMVTPTVTKKANLVIPVDDDARKFIKEKGTNDNLHCGPHRNQGVESLHFTPQGDMALA